MPVNTRKTRQSQLFTKRLIMQLNTDQIDTQKLLIQITNVLFIHLYCSNGHLTSYKVPTKHSRSTVYRYALCIAPAVRVVTTQREQPVQCTTHNS